MQLVAAASGGEGPAFIVLGVLGVLIGVSVYLFPGFFDRATRLRLRTQGLPEDDAATLERDRSRRRFIALILAVGSAAVLARGLSAL